MYSHLIGFDRSSFFPKVGKEETIRGGRSGLTHSNTIKQEAATLLLVWSLFRIFISSPKLLMSLVYATDTAEEAGDD